MSSRGHYSLSKIRRGAAHYLVGKFGSAALTFIAFSMIARLLGIHGYGVYATLLASAELAMSLSSLGMDWVTGRYLPEYRSRADASRFRKFIVGVAGLQMGVLAIVALVACMAAVPLARMIGVPDASLVMLYAGVMAVEGSARVVRDQLLSLLLAQASAQVSTLARSAAVIAALLPAALSAQPHAEVSTVALAELCASSIALIVALAALVRLVATHRPDESDQAWTPPPLAAMAKLARNAYLSMLLLLPAGGPVLTLTLSTFAGPQAAGSFGFARGLVEQIRRFLPIELFLGLIRPGVVARYAVSRDFAALNAQMALVFAVSVLAAMPVLAVLMAGAALVCHVIGGAAFAAAAPVLAVWSCTLLLFPHRRAIEVVANTAECSGACVWGSSLLALSPAVVAMLLALKLPLQAALVAPLVADIGFSLLVAALLRRGGLPYKLPAATVGRLAALQVAAVVALAFIPQPPGAAVVQLVLTAMAAVLLTWGVAAVWRPFAHAERDAINQVLPRPWFPF